MPASPQQLGSIQGVHLGGAQCTLLRAGGVLCQAFQLQAVAGMLRLHSRLRLGCWTFGGEAVCPPVFANEMRL